MPTYDFETDGKTPVKATPPTQDAPISSWQKYWIAQRKPKVPTLNEQAAESMGVSDENIKTMQDNTPAVAKDAADEYTPIDAAARNKEFSSALEAIFAANKPDIDPEKEKRYKQRSAINAIGGGLKQIFTAAQAHNGYLVQPDDNKAAVASNAAYAKLIDDNKAKMQAYNNMLMQGRLTGLQYQEKIKDADNQSKYLFYSTKQKAALEKEKNKFEALKFNAQYGLDVAKLNMSDRHFYDKLVQEGKLAEAANLLKKAQIDMGYYGINTRAKTAKEVAKTKGEATNTITFTNPNGESDEISADDVVSLYKLKLGEMEEENKKRNNGEIDYTELSTDANYQLLVKGAAGGLTQREMKYFVQDNYAKLKDKANVKSKLDSGDAVDNTDDSDIEDTDAQYIVK